MKYYVYLLLTCRNTLYCGIAQDVEKRYKEHLLGTKKGGAKYTNANKPVKIVYKKAFDTKSQALKEEIRIKKLSRKEKDKLIRDFVLS